MGSSLDILYVGAALAANVPGKNRKKYVLSDQAEGELTSDAVSFFLPLITYSL